MDKKCRSCWATTSRGRWGRWERVDPHGWPYWQRNSPFQYAARWLFERWSNSGLKAFSHPRRTQELDLYRGAALELQKHGCVSLVFRGDIALIRGSEEAPLLQPGVTFTFDPDVKEFIDDLLYQESKSEIADIDVWLRSITSDVVPGHLDANILSSGGLFLENERAYLCRWTTSIGKKL